jgi:hypothetical protein
MSENPPHVEAGRLARMMRPQGLQIGWSEDSLACLGHRRLPTRASAYSGPHGFVPLAGTALTAVAFMLIYLSG